MKMSRVRMWAIVAAGVALAMAFSACTAAQPKPTVIYLYVTPTPGVDTPTPSDVPVPTDATAPPDAAPTDTPVPTPHVTLSPSPSPSPSPTSPAGACSGSASTQAYFATESKQLTKFVVYCGHVPSKWNFKSANDNYKNGGWLTATYGGPSSAKIVIQEGAFCLTNSVACSPHDSYLGSANFGDMAGGIYSLGPGAGYAIYVNPGTGQGYTATGTNVSQATFTGIVAALVKVPKS